MTTRLWPSIGRIDMNRFFRWTFSLLLIGLLIGYTALALAGDKAKAAKKNSEPKAAPPAAAPDDPSETAYENARVEVDALEKAVKDKDIDSALILKESASAAVQAAREAGVKNTARQEALEQRWQAASDKLDKIAEKESWDLAAELVKGAKPKIGEGGAIACIERYLKQGKTAGELMILSWMPPKDEGLHWSVQVVTREKGPAGEKTRTRVVFFLSPEENDCMVISEKELAP